MFLNIRFLSVLFLLFSLSACNGGKYLKYNKEEFDKNEKGIVFFYASEQNIPLLFKLNKLGGDSSLQISNIELDSYHFFSKPKPRDLVKKHVVLEPGRYYIDYISLLKQGDLIRWYPSPGIKENVIIYGAFEVKAGEVLSLGQVDINSGVFKHYNNIKTLKDQLSDSDMSELVPRVKQGIFYNRGSLLIKDKNNNTQIISSEIVEIQRKKVLQEITRRIEKSAK